MLIPSYKNEGVFPQPTTVVNDQPLLPPQFGLTKLELFTVLLAQGYRAGKMISNNSDPYTSYVWSSSKVANAALEDALAILEVLNSHAQQKESRHQEAKGTHGQGGEVGVPGVREMPGQHGPAGGSPPPA